MIGILVQFRLVELLLLNLVLIFVHLSDDSLVLRHNFLRHAQLKLRWLRKFTTYIDVEVGPLGHVIIEATPVVLPLWIVEGSPELGVFFSLVYYWVKARWSSLVGLH